MKPAPLREEILVHMLVKEVRSVCLPIRYELTI